MSFVWSNLSLANKFGNGDLVSFVIALEIAESCRARNLAKSKPPINILSPEPGSGLLGEDNNIASSLVGLLMIQVGSKCFRVTQSVVDKMCDHKIMAWLDWIPIFA